MTKVSNSVALRLLILIMFSCLGADVYASNIDRIGQIDFTYNGQKGASLKFGLTQNITTTTGVQCLNTGVGSKVYPPPPPGPSGMIFKRDDYQATATDQGLKTSLSADFRNRDLHTQTWVLNVPKDKPSDVVNATFTLDAGFTGSESNRISLILEADTSNDSAISDTIITNSLQITDLPAGTYYIKYTYTLDATLLVKTSKTDLSSFGRWSLNNGANWKDSGTSERLEVGEAFTIVFEPNAGYVTPEPVTGNMLAEGVTINKLYYEESAKVEMAAIFEGGSMPSEFQKTKFWKVKDRAGYVNVDNTTEFSFTVEGNAGKTIVLRANEEYTAEYPAISDAWITPENQKFTLSPEGHKTGVDAIQAKYVFVPGKIVTSSTSMNMLKNSVKKVDVYLTAKPVGEVLLTVAADAALSIDGGATTHSTIELRFSEANTVQSYYVHSAENNFEVGYTSQTSDSRFTAPENMSVTTFSESLNADLSIDPASLDFGNVPVGKSITKYVIVKYSGTTALPVELHILGGTEAKIDTKSISFNDKVSGDGIIWQLNTGAIMAVPITLNAVTTGPKTYNFAVATGDGVYGAQSELKATANNAGVSIAINPTTILMGTSTPDHNFYIDVTALSGGDVNGTTSIKVQFPAGVSIKTDNLPSGFVYADSILTATVNNPIAGKKLTFGPFPATITNLNPDQVYPIIVENGINAQIILSDTIQIANLDVNGNGEINTRDLLLIERNLSRNSGGNAQSGNNIFPEGTPQENVDLVTAEELTINIEKVKKLLDVNGNGEVNTRDLLLIERKLSRNSGGNAQSGNNIFPEGTPQGNVDFVTAEELTKNIENLLKK